MKYKLLIQEGWCSYIVGDVYDTDVYPDLGMRVLNHPQDWELVEDDFVLPEKWFLKVTDENREMATQWRDSMCDPTYRDCVLRNGWYILSKHTSDNSYYLASSNLDSDYDNYKEITTEQFITHVYNPKFKPETTMSTQKLTVPISDVLRIHNIACAVWKSKIATEYLPRVNSDQQIEFTQTEVDNMFKAATESQLPVLEQIFGKRSEPIQWDKIKTGSKVMIQYDGEHCNGFNIININEPVDVVFYKTPHHIGYIGYQNTFHASGGYSSYCTFHQNGKFVLFSSERHTNYITQVIEY
jgi:hypothetical protein